jgi:CRISPR/Cas system type I-B associated protein Csh2 (Cas7 group RAMP superfamily)
MMNKILRILGKLHSKPKGSSCLILPVGHSGNIDNLVIAKVVDFLHRKPKIDVPEDKKFKEIKAVRT